MFHIILFVLKIIGIILLTLLGIFLFLIFIVLFIPIRYRLDAEKNHEIKAVGKISWLLHLLLVQISYVNHNFHIRLRVLGKTFYDSDKPKQNRKKKAKKTIRKMDKKAKRQVKQKTESITGTDTEIQKEIDSDKVEEIEENDKIEEIKEIQEKQDIQEKQVIQATRKVEDITENPMQQTRDKYESEDSTNREFQERTGGQEQEKTGRLKSVWNKVITKVKQIFNKIKNVFSKIINAFRNMKDKISKLRTIWHKMKDFIKNETNKDAIKKVFLSMKRILKHIRPSKIKINMEFGTGDPCQTGQALGGIAFLYGFYGDTIQITPNFETEIYEGTLFLKGRIRLFTLLIISIKLLVDKNFRQFIKNFKVLKEEL